MRSKFGHKLITIFEVNNKLLHKTFFNAIYGACGDSYVNVSEMDKSSPIPPKLQKMTTICVYYFWAIMIPILLLLISLP